MDCQEPFRKKRNFRIFYGRATLCASESRQDIPASRRDTSNHRRMDPLHSRRKLHRSDFPLPPPPESGEHCGNFPPQLRRAPAGQNRFTGWFRRSGEYVAPSGAAIPPPSESSKDRSPETAQRWNPSPPAGGAVRPPSSAAHRPRSPPAESADSWSRRESVRRSSSPP